MRVTTVAQMDEVLSEAARLATIRVRAANGKKLAYSSPETNEKALFEIILEVCEDRFGRESVKHVGGHKFPDVVFPFANSGVEIKCHKRAGDSLLGNSIMGSTFSLESPKAIRLLVWTESTKSVTLHDYFESVIGAEVTHSPRFRLRPGADPEECLFGSDADKVGTIEEVCFGKNGIDSERILARMRTQALATGSIPWWLGDSKPMAASSTLSVVRSSGLPSLKRMEIESLATILFPQVMGQRSRDKYNDAIAWGIATRGVLLSRDDFSANGQVSLRLPEVCGHREVKVPRSFDSGLNRLSRSFEVSLAELRLYWNAPELSTKNVKKAFREKLNHVGFEDVVRAFQMDSCPRCRCLKTQLEAKLRDVLAASVKFSICD